jgi:uncharacterized membrane protein
MKKIFTVLMSLQLILTPVAMAQSAGDQFRANPDGKKAASYLNQISSVAITTIGTTVMLNCLFAPLLPSMYIFNAGSIVYIASEIMGGKGQNAFQNRKMSDMKMLEEKMKGKQGGEVQREALEAALKDEKETLDIINGRKKWLNAVFVIYGLATIAAIVELIRSKLPTAPLDKPPFQFASCNMGGMLISANILKGVVVAAWSYKAMKSGEGMIGQYGSMAAALAVSLTGLGATLTGLLNIPEGRIAAFGIATALIKLNQSDLSKQAQTASDNIEKLEKVLAEFDKDTQTSNSTVVADSGSSEATAGAGGGMSGGVTSGGAIGALPSSSTANGSNVNALANVSTDMSKNCFSQASNQISYGTNCTKPMELAKPQFDANINIPTLRDGTNTAVDFANAVSRGDIAKADAAAGTLASMASRIDGIRNGLLKQANEEAKANNKEPFDFDKAQEKVMADINGSLMGSLNSNGISLASLGPSNLKPLENKDTKTKSGVTAVPGNKAVLPVGKAPVFNEGITNSAGSGISEGDLTKTPTLEESLSKYEDNQSDISNQSDESLFDIVTNRYFANYPKFFKRKEVNEDQAPKK